MDGRRMNTMKVAIPNSLRKRIRQQDDALTQVLTLGDFLEFIAAVPIEHQVAAEEKWNEWTEQQNNMTSEWLSNRFELFANDVVLRLDKVIQQRIASIAPAAVPRPSVSGLLTTDEAAYYLHKSTSWLLKRNDIPYVRGMPNQYRVKDLDAWMSRNRFKPKAG
jgi:hypothetical protein